MSISHEADMLPVPGLPYWIVDERCVDREHVATLSRSQIGEAADQRGRARYQRHRDGTGDQVWTAVVGKGQGDVIGTGEVERLSEGEVDIRDRGIAGFGETAAIELTVVGGRTWTVCWAAAGVD